MLAHYDAVKGRLSSEPTLTGKVHAAALMDHGVPVRATYVVLAFGGPDELDDDRVTQPQRIDSDAVYRFTVRSVAPTAEGALAVAARVQQRLVGAVLAIAGRAPEPIRLEGAGRVKADAAIDPPLCFIDDDFLLASPRAA